MNQDNRRPRQGGRPSYRGKPQQWNRGKGRGAPRSAKIPKTTLLKALVSFQWACRNRSLEAIQQGRVILNDVVTDQPNVQVRLDRDVISVDGQVLQRKTVKPITIIFHKPKGLSGSREEGMLSLYSFLSNKRSWYAPAGVLPKTASGIVIISNDKRHRDPDASPVYQLTQDLWIKVHRFVEEKDLATLRTQIADLIEMPLEDVEVREGQRNTHTSWIAIEHTWINLPEVSVLLKPLGYEVLSWERRRVGPFTVENLHPGSWYQVPDHHVVALEELAYSGIDDTVSLDEVWENIFNKLQQAARESSE
jgi:23S rRNA pseudouridine2457 synthase